MSIRVFNSILLALVISVDCFTVPYQLVHCHVRVPILQRRLGIPRPLYHATSKDYENEDETLTRQPSLLEQWRETRWTDWGIEQQSRPPRFPSTADDVVEEAVQAIVGVVHGTQSNDPNVVQNALDGENILGRRPVRRRWDAGRIGIEIDGAASLFSRRGGGGDSEVASLRRIALLISSRLTRQQTGETTRSTNSGATETTRRPVAVYFNTIKQALMASQELKSSWYLDRESSHHQDNHNTKNNNHNAVEDITIRCLVQDPQVPKFMTNPKRFKKGGRPPREGLHTGKVDFSRGVIVVVQPTDYNSEYRPPGPAVGVLEAFQRLIAQAAVDEIPVVVISPRLVDLEAPLTNGWDQSGYQQASMYGGSEPPRGPTPWIMRDFFPPVLSWISCAVAITYYPSHTFQDARGEKCYYTGVSVFQSVMYEGHSWHLFAQKQSTSTSTSTNNNNISPFEYIASTKTAAGRPTRDLLLRVFSEFATYS